MTKKRLPKSQRKHIRREKARIRREVLDLKKQQEEIKKLYEKIYKKSKIKNTSGNTNRVIAQNVLSGKDL